MTAKYELPESITLPDGTVLSHRYSIIRGFGISYEEFKVAVRKRGGRLRLIRVLSRNLRGKRDLHGDPYAPGEWLFSDLSLFEIAKEIIPNE